MIQVSRMEASRREADSRGDKGSEIERREYSGSQEGGTAGGER